MASPSATPSEKASTREKDKPSCIERVTALKDDELFMIFALLPRNTLTNVARVCKRWNKISTPQINFLVDFVFSIGSQQRNHSLLQSLRNKNSTVAQQIRVIKIEDWLSPSGVEIEREKEFHVGDIGNEDHSEQVLQPLAQLHQLVLLIPNLPLSKLIWAGKLTIPTRLLRMVSQQTSLDFEVLTSEFGQPLLSEICRLPRRRLKLVESMNELNIMNITKLEFCVPISRENTRLVQLLGKLIRASSRLRILTLVAILPMVPLRHKEVLMCPWATRGARILSFPQIQELRLENFKLDLESARDRDSWRRLIQWSEVVKFTTDCNLFFSEYNMPKLTHLKLLDGFEPPEYSLPMGQVHKMMGAFQLSQEASRECLIGCPPLTHLEVSDEFLLDKAIWERHKKTLRYLKMPACRMLRTTTVQGQIIRELASLPLLTHIAAEIIPPLLPGTIARAEPPPMDAIWYDIMDLTPGLVWVQHLELDLSYIQASIGFQYCKELWTDIFQTILRHGTTLFGSDYRPRLRQLDLKYQRWGGWKGQRKDRSFRVTFSEHPNAAGQVNCFVVCLEREHLRRWGEEHQESPGCRGYQSIVGRWDEATSATLGTPNSLDSLFMELGGDDISESELPGLVSI